jgi:hypothetical protein
MALSNPYFFVAQLSGCLLALTGMGVLTLGLD